MLNKPELGPTSDFSPIAARYDATRDLPEHCLRACYDRLAKQGLLPATGIILDAGCGTGQISLPLASMGYEVRGIDVSSEMVAIAQAKCPPEWRARYVVADVRAIPEANESIDAVVVSKLFQHVHGWQTAYRELSRVLKRGGCIVHLTERGAFGNSVRQYFGSRADALGFTTRFLGPRDKASLEDALLSNRCSHVLFDTTDLRWEKRITHGEAFDHLQERLYAEFWYLPSETHELLLAETKLWIEEQPGKRDAVDEMKPYLVTDVFRKT